MNTVEKTIAAALAGLQDDTAALRRLRQALGSRRKDNPAPEMSGVRTVCWHPVDRLPRHPASLPGFDDGQALGAEKP